MGVLYQNTTLKAQNRTIKGKVIDAETAEGIPFANVYPKNNPSKGTTTDFEGYYSITYDQLEDSLVVSYIGYVTKLKPISAATSQEGIWLLDFQLEGDNTKLEEIVIEAGEDPAYPIMRQVIKNKRQNDYSRLEFYEYESYIKIELDIDNVSEKFKKRKIIRDVSAAVDSAGGLTGEDGKSLIPVFMSETISRYYYRRSPERRKEEVLKTKIDGVGLEQDSPISQILGSSFQQYNFYNNWLKILDKDFVSPVADSWKFYYDYYLADSLYLGEDWCYKIEVVPKREEDLAFDGAIWVDSESFGLKQIDARTSKKANINFVEKIKIQQALEETETGAWIPAKTRVLVDIAELTDSSAGIIAKFYTSNKDIVVNKEHPLKFYKQGVVVDQNASNFDDDFWVKNRHDSLTPQEIQTYALIDTIKQVPIIKTYSEILRIVSSGYKKVGPVDVGHLVYTYALNNVEGSRFRVGLRTNTDFSRKFEFKGYLAYGTLDNRFKYSAALRYIPFRKNWTEIGIERQEDIIQAAANPDGIAAPGAFIASLSFFDVQSRSPFWRYGNSAYLQTDLAKWLRFRAQINNYEMRPIGEHFGFFAEPNLPDSPLLDSYNTTELVFETRIAHNESYYYEGNNRYVLSASKLPVLTLRYTRGLPGLLNGDFDYHKFTLGIEHDLGLGILGRSYYSLTAGYTPNTLPYPLLNVHLGNRGVFFNFYGFGLMDFLEFVSDQYVSINYEHDFAGLISNRLPLIRKLKWRFFVVANVVAGNLSPSNAALSPTSDSAGNLLSRPVGLGDEPYTELGYGIGNIFRFFRVTFLHRVNYLEDPNQRRFGVFFSARFQL